MGNIAKIIHKQINTFETCKKWQTSLTSICPLCRMKPETHRHILSCPYALVQQERNQSIEQVIHDLERSETHPKLLEYLKQAIALFVVDYPLQQPNLSMNEQDIMLCKIHHSQNNIGWNNFLRGFITAHMEEMQRKYCATRQKQNPTQSASQWSKHLVTLVVNHYVVLINDETLEKRMRQQACESSRTTKRKWWTLLPSDRYSLNQNEFWLRRSPYINVMMWIDQLKMHYHDQNI